MDTSACPLGVCILTGFHCNLVLRLLGICAQSHGNSVSFDLLFSGGMPPDPSRRDWLQQSIVTIRLLRNFCQLLQKLWTTLFDIHVSWPVLILAHKPQLTYVCIPDILSNGLNFASVHRPLIHSAVSKVLIGHFANKSFRLQVDSPTLTSIPLHNLSCFAYTEVISPT